MTRRFRMTAVMPSNPFIEILTGTNIAAASLLAYENVNVKHVVLHCEDIGLAGFEPTTWRRGDRSNFLT